jgi:nickel superoxide dismutase
MKTRTLLTVLSTLLFLSIAAPRLAAHCQVPCGIYGDQGRLDRLHEDGHTIEKAIRMINELGAAGEKNYNQIVRWVMTKEDHADHIAGEMQTYFMAQRIKESQENYEELLVAAHRVIVAAMKCKQAADPAAAEALQEALDAFAAEYAKAG